MSLLDDDIYLDDKVLKKEADIHRILAKKDQLNEIHVRYEHNDIKYVFDDGSDICVDFDTYNDKRLYDINGTVELIWDDFTYDMDTIPMCNNAGLVSSYKAFIDICAEIDNRPKNITYKCDYTK